MTVEPKSLQLDDAAQSEREYNDKFAHNGELLQMLDELDAFSTCTTALVHSLRAKILRFHKLSPPGFQENWKYWRGMAALLLPV